MAKIKKEQLEKVVELQKNLNELLHRTGVVETQKHALLHDIAEVNKEVQKYNEVLKEEYGPISLDLQTGEYTVVEENNNE